MTKTAITTHVVAIVGAIVTFLGVPGIDAGTISALVQGIAAGVTIVSTILAYYLHNKTASTVKA